MNLARRKIYIGKIPAILWGQSCEKICIYIHGQYGNKEEAELFSKIVCKHGWQVISVDLPEHGERVYEKDKFNPLNVVAELKSLMNFIKNRWPKISLYATSIGAYFSILAYKNDKIYSCLFVSPILDMKKLILDMMSYANVTATQLEQCKIIKTDFGQILSWEYFKYVLDNPIEKWDLPTEILYGKKDEMVKIDTIIKFASNFNCSVTICNEAEHWFHTEKQLRYLKIWILEKFCKDKNFS
ncbi:alpha/beta hydrolase [Campylobacter sp. MOP7]|uniref:alpha/beta hydrolase n=1 Tax=Campylobacter canis TaxID=3378588 RepID=UPI00387E9B89